MQLVKLAEEEDHLDFAEAYDDMSGAPLDPKMAYKAQMEELNVNTRHAVVRQSVL